MKLEVRGGDFSIKVVNAWIQYVVEKIVEKCRQPTTTTTEKELKENRKYSPKAFFTSIIARLVELQTTIAIIENKHSTQLSKEAAQLLSIIPWYQVLDSFNILVQFDSFHQQVRIISVSKKSLQV